MMYNMKLSIFTSDESFPFFIQYGEHNEDMYMHGHEDFYELVIVLDGSAAHVVGEHRYPIKKGEVFAVGKNICHGYEEVNSLRICNIMFRPEMFISGSYDVKQLTGFHALFLLEPHFGNPEDFRSRLSLSPDSYNEVRGIISTAVKEYENAAAGSRTMITACFLRLAVLLSRLYGKAEKRREITGIAEAAAFMESNYSDDITIERLLSVSHYSQRHFIRLFSEIYGVSPHRYLLDIRMRHARELLGESSLSVAEVAYRCGFADANYFSRIFKKHTGATPLEYRNS